MKKFPNIIFAGVLVFGIASTALADDVPLSVPEATDPITTMQLKTAEDDATKLQKLCLSGEFEARFNAAVTKKEDRLNKRRDLVDQNMEKRRALRDQQRVEKEALIVETLSEKNPARLELHQIFSKSVDSAVAARRSAVDLNLAAFRKSVNEINANTKSLITAKIASLKTTVCDSTATKDQIKTAWQQFQEEIKSIKAKHRSDKLAAGKSLKSANLNNLSVFKSALEKANQERKTALEEIRK